MGEIWIREFLGGLDARRMAETTPGGVLIQADDVHITAGGEVESRAAFVEAYTLPAGTFGLAATRSQLVTFGSATAPTMPEGVAYQRLQHPDTVTALASVPSWDLYAGKIYAATVFADGSRHHYYDAVRVSNWFDGRARASFSVVSGGTAAAVPAVASFRITGGTDDTGNEISSITANGVELLGGAVEHTGGNVTTAEDVADAINAHTSSPNYTATSDGDTVRISAAIGGVAANGRVLGVTVGGDVTVSTVTDFAGGVDAAPARLDNLRINGVSIISGPITYTTDNSATATAIANDITSNVSTPEYTAIAVADTVIITASTAGTAANDLPVTFTVANGLVLTPTSLAMSGGAVSAGTFTPGDFVKTVGSKMYSLSGPNMHFSGIGQPTQWTTDFVGAGFVDLSSHASGAENLLAAARYQQQLAVFAETNVQIWFIDPDPALNTQVQVLNNTGTTARNSVTQFGDNDIFYLGENGIRSLRARYASDAASTSDIGVPIDTLVTDAMDELGANEFDKVFGLVEPRDGRFWMIVGDKVFVLSYFRAEKTVSAWSRYNLPGEVDAAVVFNKKVWLRIGNKVYVYGGAGATREYDDTECVVRTPFLDADRPEMPKYLTGIDVAASGEWRVFVSSNINLPDANEQVGTVFMSTFADARVPGHGSASHYSFTFKTNGVGPHKLGSLMLHFNNDFSRKNAS